MHPLTLSHGHTQLQGRTGNATSALGSYCAQKCPRQKRGKKAPERQLALSTTSRFLVLKKIEIDEDFNQKTSHWNKKLSDAPNRTAMETFGLDSGALEVLPLGPQVHLNGLGQTAKYPPVPPPSGLCDLFL